MWSVMRLRTLRRSTRRTKNDRMKNNVSRTASEKQRTLERQFGPPPPTKNRFLRSLYWAVRGCQYWLCFYDDEVEVDVEDLLSNPFNTQPPSLDQLQKLTGFNREWLVFLYRNFKQRCLNGRMTESQWRSVFRLIFPAAANLQYADRLFRTISKNRGHQQITFEDLVLFLWELTESGRCSQFNSHAAFTASTTAQFVFDLIGPDEKGRVDEMTFANYVRSVFELYSAQSVEGALTLGLPTGSIYRSSKNSTEESVRPVSLLIRRYAAERFKSLDTNGDGFITSSDIQQAIENDGNWTVLHSLAELQMNSEIHENVTEKCSSSGMDENSRSE